MPITFDDDPSIVLYDVPFARAYAFLDTIYDKDNKPVTVNHLDLAIQACVTVAQNIASGFYINTSTASLFEGELEPIIHAARESRIIQKEHFLIFVQVN
jgi:hypothetical protein